MSANKKVPEISAADFPALREFLRGYFHEDLGDEYGSPEAAARRFCQDASSEQREAVAAEWARFHTLMNGQPLTIVNRALTGKLGSRILMGTQDLEKLSALFHSV